MNRPRLWTKASGMLLLTLLLCCQSYTPRPGDELLTPPRAYDRVELAFPRPFDGNLNHSLQYWTVKASLLKATLTINKKGQVKKIDIDWANQPSLLTERGMDAPPDWANSLRWQAYDSLLRLIEFIPGRYNGKRVTQQLPIIITDNPENARVNILFPLDTTGTVIDADLYWRTVRLNGGELPEIKSFPKYFIISDKKSDTTKLDYLLSKISYEPDETVAGFELIHSDAGQFSKQILSAANWADYNAVTQKGREVGPVDDAFLAVALYNLAGYPTTIFAPPFDSLRLPDQNRMHLVSDTLGLMFKPFPIAYPKDGLYSVLGGRMEEADTLNILVTIGSSGVITRLSLIGETKKQAINYYKWAQWLKFYPALNFKGEPQAYSGLMLMEYQSGTIIRIKFCWMPGQCGCYSF